MKNGKDSDKGHFYDKIYDVVRKIPHGRVTSYGLIARHLGSPQASRMVGYAMNNAHNQEDYVPAHRVVNRNGVLTGKHHFHGEHVMQDLLQSEGIMVENDKIIDFETHLWDPGKELSL